LGNSQDLQIYHDGTDSIIKAAGTATPIKIQGHSSNASTVHISARADKETIKCLNNSNAPYVELYYDNTWRFKTESWGVSVNGNLALGDNEYLNVGGNNDLQIFHDGESRVKNVGTASSLYLQTHRGGLINEAASEWGVLFEENSSVRLYYDGSEKFVSTSAGVQCQANTDIRFTNGSWTGEHAGKIQHHSNYFYIQGGSNGIIFRDDGGTNRWEINSSGTLHPNYNNSYDIGTSILRVRNIYVNDLQLSNEAKKDTGGNDVDGTWGDWTLQEGEEDIFMINNRSGKKYKMALQEVN